MTDLKKLSEERAEEYAAKKYGIPTHYSETEDFKAGFQSCLDLLAKQSGEFREWYLLIHDSNPTLNQITKTPTPAAYLMVSHHTQFHVIDIAALLAANAKNAELQQRVKELSHSTVLAANQVLQERVRELESEVEDRKESYSKLDDFNINLNEKIKELESELVRMNDNHRKEVAGIYKRKEQEFYGTNKLNEKLIELAGEKESLKPVSPIIFNPNAELQTKLTTLEAKLQEAEYKTEFVKQYYNPKDTRFQTMVHNFMSLTNEQKSKLIEVAKNLKDLSDLQNKGG